MAKAKVSTSSRGHSRRNGLGRGGNAVLRAALQRPPQRIKKPCPVQKALQTVRQQFFQRLTAPPAPSFPRSFPPFRRFAPQFLASPNRRPGLGQGLRPQIRADHGRDQNKDAR